MYEVEKKLYSPQINFNYDSHMDRFKSTIPVFFTTRDNVIVDFCKQCIRLNVFQHNLTSYNFEWTKCNDLIDWNVAYWHYINIHCIVQTMISENVPNDQSDAIET